LSAGSDDGNFIQQQCVASGHRGGGRHVLSSRPVDSAHASEPPAVFAQIDRALRGNDLMQAIELAKQALDAGYSSPVLFGLRAHWRKHNGQAFEAIGDLERALEMEPNSAKILTEIGDCLNGLGHHRKALVAVDEALSFDADFSQAWFQKGLAHQLLNELEQARAAYERAVRLNPRLSDALGRLAAMAVQQGEHDAARGYAARALAVRPTNDVAQLALIDIDLAEDCFDAAGAGIQSLLAHPQTPALTRAIALSHLGDLRDRQERYGEAFAAYSHAGEVWRGVYAPRYQRPGHESVPQMLERLTADLGALPAVPTQPPGPRVAEDDSAGLAFVLGFPRSGTTLLGQILASRTDVALFEEKPLLTRAITDFIHARGGLAKLAVLPDAELTPYREDFWQRARQSGIETRGKLVVEQTAFNTVYLPVIRRLFPDAPVVFAQRDPRDVAFSCFRRLFGPNLFTLEFHSLDGAAQLYGATMQFAHLCHDSFDVRPLEIRNEDLIADFDGVTRRLFAHLGMAWDETVRDFQKSTRQRLVATRSATQVRRGISSDGVGHWQNYREQMAPVLPVLEPWVERFGYSPR
jgi:tetratricopeptide (TPR) repeat protein